MTPEHIRERVLSDPQLKELGEKGDDSGIAALLTETQPVTYWLTADGVFDLFGPKRGAAIMQAMRAEGIKNNPTGKTIAEWLLRMEGRGINIGHADAMEILNSLVSQSVVTADELTRLLALTNKTVSPSHSDVSKALKPLRPDGKVGKLGA